MALAQRVLSTLTVAYVGLTCKAVLSTGLCSVKVTGLNHLLNALQANDGRGVVTGSSQNRPLRCDAFFSHPL